MTWEIRHGDCLELMRAMPDNSVDAVVTDPPYGLSFMGKKWDYDVPSTEVWAECLRVLKPGGHLLAFAGTRTQHRMAVRIEDAGFEIRDMIAWVYGSGFPKSLDVSKAIDKAAGAEREVVGTSTHIHSRGASTAFAKRPGEKEQASPQTAERGNIITAPATDAARKWQGWGTALKPSAEPLTVARKPLDWRGLCLSLAQYITSQLCQYAASVKDVGPSSSSSPSASGADQSGSALWSAVAQCNTPGDLFALMDTLPCGSAHHSSLSTAFSWLRTLDGLLKHESTFTTETASSLTTDLRTLNCLLSASTPSTIIAELTEPSGRGSSVELVETIFNACDASLKSTLARSAHEGVIERARESYLDAGASPAMEPITVARKPLVGTVAANVLEHGTGALNIEGCRVEADWANDPSMRGVGYGFTNDGFPGDNGAVKFRDVSREWRPTQGRWPANLIHDGSEEVMECFPDVKAGVAVRRNGGQSPNPTSWDKPRIPMPDMGYGDKGSAARFFYCAKASRTERNKGLDGFDTKEVKINKVQNRPCANCGGWSPNLAKYSPQSCCACGKYEPVQHRTTASKNFHPTVKPIALMRYLVRLVTPPGGTVLDPFTGSGSTGKAAILEGFNFIGCEREAEYVEIARARIAHVEANPEPKPQQLSIFDTP